VGACACRVWCFLGVGVSYHSMIEKYNETDPQWGQNWQDAVAAHRMLVVVARRPGARGQHVDVLAGWERGGRHGEGHGGEDLGELHVVWWGRLGLRS
jgi:hypothetical protein